MGDKMNQPQKYKLIGNTMYPRQDGDWYRVEDIDLIEDTVMPTDLNLDTMDCFCLPKVEGCNKLGCPRLVRAKTDTT